MAKLISLSVNKQTNEPIWVNADRILYVRGVGANSTNIYFDKDHSISVDESLERVMLLLDIA